MTIRRLQTDSMARDVIIAALHFPDKRNWSESDQHAEAPRFADLVQQAETQARHQRTILFGDFNMSPFEKGLVNASGFNAVMTRSIAEKRERTVQGRAYPFFYNPMWSLAGDLSPGPAGTYYMHPSGHSSYYWHTFDQLLIRPDLLEAFDPSMLHILDSDGEKSLLSTNGIPGRTEGSDHLPLTFRFNL